MFFISTKRAKDTSKLWTLQPLMSQTRQKINWNKKSIIRKMSFHKVKSKNLLKLPKKKPGFCVYCNYKMKFYKERLTKSEKNNPAAITKLRQSVLNKVLYKFWQRLLLLVVMHLTMMITHNIILKVCQWDGMVNLYHIGSTNYTVLDRNLNVKFAAEQVIGEEEHLRSIFRNGVTLTEWNVYVYQTQVISKM